MSKAKIYVLFDPSTMERKYVGQTRCNPKTRLRFHYRNLNKKIKLNQNLSPVQRWLRNMRNEGRKAIIQIIDANAKWDISEAVWIERLNKDGARLLNVSSIVK